jgi:hypothetical protein
VSAVLNGSAEGFLILDWQTRLNRKSKIENRKFFGAPVQQSLIPSPGYECQYRNEQGGSDYRPDDRKAGCPNPHWKQFR